MRSLLSSVYNSNPGSKLPVVVHALDALGLELAFAQGGQQEAGEDGNDGDDDQQFDEGESGNRGKGWNGMPGRLKQIDFPGGYFTVSIGSFHCFPFG